MAVSTSSETASIIQKIPIDKIRPSPHQVRKDFYEGDIRSLAESIDKEGLIQPITVRRVGDFYEIIAGERRWRAVKSLNRPTIDARIIEVPNEAAATAKGLVENLQRKDLNPMEEAEGFSSLNRLDPGYWTHDRIAAIAGKDRTYITKSLGFLALPESIRSDNVLRSTFTRNHLIQLCRLADPVERDRTIQAVSNGLTVEETRKMVDFVLGKLIKKDDVGPADNQEMEIREVDPIATIWPPLLGSREIDAMGGWVVSYRKKHWNFMVSSIAVPTQGDLAKWFKQMGAALSMGGTKKSHAEKQSKSRITEPLGLMPSTTEELDQLLREQRNLRLPKTAEEDAELQALVSQGPHAVYGWIYGQDSLLASKVSKSSWADLGVEDPQASLKELLATMRSIQR